MDTTTPKNWHHLTETEAAALLETDSAKGLDLADVKRRQSRFGANKIKVRKGKPPLLIFLLQFHQPLIYILLSASAVTFALAQWADGAVIFAVVVVNAMIGFVQETKARKAIEALTNALAGFAVVVREGERHKIASAEIVPGDLVVLQSGDKVPADLRLLRSRDLQIDESVLTGESLPVHKQTERLAAQTILADRANMAYSSTLVTYGVGVGMVVATGDATEIGRINALIAEAAVLATPLTKKIATFSRVLLWIILALAAVTYLAGWWQGYAPIEAFMAAVALAVGAIPEGLPAAMTIMLAIGAGKMAHRHAIIRKIPAVETLGGTTVICSDKTGTLTQNQMTVREVFSGEVGYQVTGEGYAPDGKITLHGMDIDPARHRALGQCLSAGVLCNDSRLVDVGGHWTCEGDPTEVALIVAAAKVGLLPDDLERKFPRIDTLPFESQHQYMATLHEKIDGPLPSGGETRARVIYVKGSLESVLSRSSHALGGREESEAPFDRAEIHRQGEALAEKGLRVLAFARKIPVRSSGGLSHGDVADGLCFLGLQAMMDPPRREAITAVAACRRAGIQVKMITGDHAVTARAIARQIGLDGSADSDPNTFTVSGHTLAAVSDTDLIELAGRAVVFARVAPEQKLRLVKALQASGHVVAMTGDGVNDAPALKQADIGIAMGKSGAEVAKEAADMVLTDDNFATIEAAVEEGRAVFDNFLKFITWTLPTNLAEGFVVLLAVFSGQALPITPVQILWINMATALLLGLMLTFEGKEPGIMERPPRHPQTPILTHALAFRIVLVGLLLVVGSFGFFEWALQTSQSVEVARTLAVNMFVFGELFYLLNCRSLRYSMVALGVFSNRPLLFGVVAMGALQVVFTYAPGMNAVFGSAPLNIVQWALVVGGGIVIFAVVGAEKWLRVRAGKPWRGPGARGGMA
ncbi:cation-transporting P-type ATPase [Varunaivibrio sulfuroxidans]|uniref:Potassium/sodium efflux P-type ATPase n=1 Tax=Varunaivibrio sulfuroxidans TaxID=1773489 RepID=A0A4R3J7G4_9PROT|nr:cation-transporting P-type ATPase [Varunaivibrio sulfuroxidans]TCS61367.1 potassium/sodium efflux P-type ATPase [Varunaivibrio sulfuroxidans]WES31021.1 cation-transporting P-type ATPase [Varunaivibrio sulfuroxidans]